MDRSEVAHLTILVVLSGPTAVGKSTLSTVLTTTHGFAVIPTSAHLKSLAADRGIAPTKDQLQNLGDELDVQTNFSWVVEDVLRPSVSHGGENRRWLLDSARKQRQLELIRRDYGPAVFHVHLTADEELLRERYQARSRVVPDHANYDEVSSHPNELESRSLGRFADLVIDVSREDIRAAVDAISEYCERRESR